MKVINDQGSGCYRILLINYYHNEVKSRTLLLTYQPTVITLNRKNIIDSCKRKANLMIGGTFLMKNTVKAIVKLPERLFILW